MTAEIINLRQFRKARERAAKEEAAAENRSRFGRTRQDRDHEAATDQMAKRQHAAHALVDPDRSDTSDASDAIDTDQAARRAFARLDEKHDK